MVDWTRRGLHKEALGPLSWLWASCERVSFSESESHDQDRLVLERLMVRAHQLTCPACRRFRIQLRVLGAALGRLKAGRESGDGLPGLFLPPDVRERIKTALQGVNDPSGPVFPRAPTD
jgi:hypothetical protein